MSTNEANDNIFGKGQIVNSALFYPKEKDVLKVILQDDMCYTLEEAAQLLESFLTKEVI